MGKMIFDEYDDAPMSPAVTKPRNVIAPNRTPPVKSRSGTDTITAIGNAVAGMVEPVVAVIDHALTFIPDILGCISTMVVECEHTKQIKAQVRGQIELAKQETKRVEIQELELTKRTLAGYEKEIRQSELDLRRFREELAEKEKAMKVNHAKYMAALDAIEKQAKPLINAANALTDMIPKVINDDNKLQLLLTKMNVIHQWLVEFAKQVVAIRNGGNL